MRKSQRKKNEKRRNFKGKMETKELGKQRGGHTNIEESKTTEAQRQKHQQGKQSNDAKESKAPIRKAKQRLRSNGRQRK